MGMYVTVSARMRRELLEEARRLNINTSELIRCTLENEVRRHRPILLEERLKGKRKYAVRRFIIKPKGMIPSHKHKNTETLVILKGKGKVCVNNQIREVQSGDFVFINSNIPHALENEYDEDFEFICIISYEDDMSIQLLESICGK